MTVSEAFIQAYEARFPGSTVKVRRGEGGGYSVTFPGGNRVCMTAAEMKRMTRHHIEMAKPDSEIFRYDEWR